jgi:TfoX/Sxy family transcriptional regulator of competence genes
MSTSKDAVAYVLEQLEPLDVRARAMFGEYAVYCNDKVIGFVCDDTLLMKPTTVAEEFGADLPRIEPYPEAKKYYGVPTDRLTDTEWLHAFVQATADILPKPKPKAPKKKS